MVLIRLCDIKIRMQPSSTTAKDGYRFRKSTGPAAPVSSFSASAFFPSFLNGKRNTQARKRMVSAIAQIEIMSAPKDAVSRPSSHDAIAYATEPMPRPIP